MEKAIDIELKASLQPLLDIRKVDSQYSKCYRLIKKDKDKNKTNWEH